MSDNTTYTLDPSSMVVGAQYPFKLLGRTVVAIKDRDGGIDFYLAQEPADDDTTDGRPRVGPARAGEG